MPGQLRWARLAACSVWALCGSCLALNLSVPRINGDDARSLLGDGTGVIVGIVDSGVDFSHPFLAGNDSLGNPRLAAIGNFVPTEPGNAGEDVFGHGTAVAGVVLGNDAAYRGIATDARYISARGLDANNSFSTDAWVINAMGFALANRADVINLSISYSSTTTTGSTRLALMSDWASYALGVPVVGITHNDFSNAASPMRAGGDGYNMITAAASASNAYDQVALFSRIGPTTDGRCKPDITAPGQSITTANANWETQADYNSWSGTSFAAPHIAGLLASQIEFGRANGLSTNPLVLKSTLLNSAEKIRDRTGGAWEPNAYTSSPALLSVTSPLDTHAGAGQANGLALYEQYRAGRHGPGSVPAIGWDLNTIAGISSLDYLLMESPRIGTIFAATLTWFRHVNRTDNGNGVIDEFDLFTQAEALDNLDLQVLRDGVPVAQSISTRDNVEHLYFTVVEPGAYSIRVNRLNVAGSGSDELYSLAWRTTPVPEPAMPALAALATLAMQRRSRSAFRRP